MRYISPFMKYFVRFGRPENSQSRAIQPDSRRCQIDLSTYNAQLTPTPFQRVKFLPGPAQIPFLEGLMKHPHALKRALTAALGNDGFIFHDRQAVRLNRRLTHQELLQIRRAGFQLVEQSKLEPLYSIAHADSAPRRASRFSTGTAQPYFRRVSLTPQ